MLTRGELALDGKGCLRPTRNADPGPQGTRCPGPGAQDLVPIWPSTFEPNTSGGEVRILAGQRMVAQVGKAVEMCGGETSAEEILRGNDRMGERELRESSERCPDYYRFVGAGTRIPGNAPPAALRPLRPLPYRT